MRRDRGELRRSKSAPFSYRRAALTPCRQGTDSFQNPLFMSLTQSAPLASITPQT